MKEAPECRVCNHRHWNRDQHVLIGGPEPSKDVRELAAVAQRSERRSYKAKVDGSTPSRGTITIETGPMSADEARTATDEAKGLAEDLWRRLYVLHEREAWRALGYETWAAYVAAEFDMSKRRVNQLVAHARIVLAIEGQVGTTVPTSEQPTERATRAISSDPAAVARVRRMVRRGVSPRLAVDKATGAPCEHPRTLTVVVCADCGNRVE